MYRFFALLISVLSLTAHAELAYNGYAYITNFSDQSWYDNRSMAAVNVDWTSTDTGFAARTQVSTYSQQHLRRAVIEYSHPVGASLEAVYQVGRFTRLDSFFNGVTDSPADYGMAMMPEAGYSYRMLNGAFALLDGVQGQVTYKGDSFILRTRLAYGAVPVASDADLLMEAFKRQVSGAVLKGTHDSQDYSVHLETERFHGYVSRNEYNFRSEKQVANALSNQVDTSYHKIFYTLDKMGARYDFSRVWAQTEWFHDYTWREAKFTGKRTDSGNSIGMNGIIGARVWSNLSAYGGRSYARNKATPGSQNTDNFVGLTWAAPTYTVSVEKHAGDGYAWRKYMAPAMTSPAIPTWNSYVASVTYKF